MAMLNRLVRLYAGQSLLDLFKIDLKAKENLPAPAAAFVRSDDSLLFQLVHYPCGAGKANAQPPLDE